MFSFRGAGGGWDPKLQRPELWNLYNARVHAGESIRVFPLSNWTERDIWDYVAREKVPIVPLYLAAERPTVVRDGTLLMVDDPARFPGIEREEVVTRRIRFRTMGCWPLTGAMESEARYARRGAGRDGGAQDQRAAGPGHRPRRKRVDGSEEARGLFLMDLLRFITCGSVDDGKSTLIGRLLHDSAQLMDDQLAALESDSRRMGTQGQEIDFALLVDGLAAEREQGITIDVAYRFFSSATRRFIVADCPGHEQYTRNMATGASTADAAVLLVDARKGVLTQTRRHAAICRLMGVRHLILAVNKMDLVGFDRARFEAIAAEGEALGAATAIPLSGLTGDNVFARSAAMDWYSGPTLMEALDALPAQEDEGDTPLRLPVQWVNRPHQDFRGYCGLIAGGSVQRGQDVRVLAVGADQPGVGGAGGRTRGRAGRGRAVGHRDADRRHRVQPRIGDRRAASPAGSIRSVRSKPGVAGRRRIAARAADIGCNARARVSPRRCRRPNMSSASIAASIWRRGRWG